MARTFETSEQSGIFVVRVNGERSPRYADDRAELVNFWTGVASAMKQAGLHRLLAVISVRGDIRSLDIHGFYRNLGQMGFKADMRMAIIFAVPDHERQVLQTGVDGAARDGWTIRHFVSESEAREWL
jgi:hypothetical protein